MSSMCILRLAFGLHLKIARKRVESALFTAYHIIIYGLKCFFSYQLFLTFTGRTRTKDKYRVVYSDHQRLELEKEFHYSRYITIRRKAELAQALNLSERQVSPFAHCIYPRDHFYGTRANKAIFSRQMVFLTPKLTF